MKKLANFSTIVDKSLNLTRYPTQKQNLLGHPVELL